MLLGNAKSRLHKKAKERLGTNIALNTLKLKRQGVAKPKGLTGNASPLGRNSDTLKTKRKQRGPARRNFPWSSAGLNTTRYA